MGYRVYYILKNQMTFEDYPKATKIQVTQNHLHVLDERALYQIIAIYQSGWWIKAVQIDENTKTMD